MSTDQNKALIRGYTDLMNQHNLDAAFANLSADFRTHNVPPTGMPGDIEATRQFFTMLFNAFADFQATLEDVIAEGDRVVIRVTGRGTHTAEFMGVPLASFRHPNSRRKVGSVPISPSGCGIDTESITERLCDETSKPK